MVQVQPAPRHAPPPPASLAEVRALAGYAIAAGLVLIAFGTLRLRLRTPVDSPYSARSISVTYSVMIVLGLVLIVLAVFWRSLG